MSYSSFKHEVVVAADYRCENPHCGSSEDLTAHHFLKQSTYPQYKEDPDNGMCSCGRCHSEIERRQREGEDFTELYPMRRYLAMCEKAGVKPYDHSTDGGRKRRAKAIRRLADELEQGQEFLGLVDE